MSLISQKLNQTSVNVVAGLILGADGRGLIAKRSSAMSSPGLWELPGGKTETDETDDVALIRELQEELSVTVAVGKRFATVRAIIRERPYVMSAYCCRLIHGVIRPTEHAEVLWISADDIPSLTWAPLDVPLLPQLSEVLRNAVQGRL